MSPEDTSTTRNNNVVPYDYGDKKVTIVDIYKTEIHNIC